MSYGSNGVYTYYNPKYIANMPNTDPSTVSMSNLKIGRKYTLIGRRSSVTNSVKTNTGCTINGITVDGSYIEVDFTPTSSTASITFAYYLNNTVLVN